MPQSRSLAAAFAAAGTVVLWASAFPAISVAVAQLGATGLSVARLAAASVALAAAAPFLHVRRPARRDLPQIGAVGLAMAAYVLLLNFGERTVSAGTASLLIATAPIYTSLLATAFFKEQPTARRWVGSAIAFAGSAVIAASHGLGFGLAALVVLAAAVVQALFHVGEKSLLTRYTSFELTCYAIWSGTLFVLPWTGDLLAALPHASAVGIGAALFLGVAPSAVGFVLWGYALARMDVSTATIALYLVPAVAIVVALVWLGQRPTTIELVGGAVALAGVALSNTTRRRTEEKRAPDSGHR